MNMKKIFYVFIMLGLVACQKRSEQSSEICKTDSLTQSAAADTTQQQSAFEEPQKTTETIEEEP